MYIYIYIYIYKYIYNPEEARDHSEEVYCSEGKEVDVDLWRIVKYITNVLQCNGFLKDSFGKNKVLCIASQNFLL